MLPTCSSTVGDYLDSWGSTTQNFSASFYDKSHAKKEKKNSHVKEKFSRCNPRVQKFHIKTKNPCKFFFSHNQNPHDQKLFTTKNHAPKKVNAPPKISPQSKCFTYPYTTTKSFFHNHAQKFLHDQDSQQIISYMSMHKK